MLRLSGCGAPKDERRRPQRVLPPTPYRDSSKDTLHEICLSQRRL